MANLKVPLVVWIDGQGHYTAKLLDEFSTAISYDKDPKAAIRQIREYLAKSSDSMSAPSVINAKEAELGRITVPLRPEYQEGRKNFPSNRVLKLKVPFVAGGSNYDGLGLCFLPTIDIVFDYYLEDRGTLSDLIIHKTQNHFRGATPETLLRHLEPTEIYLETINVSVKESSFDYYTGPTELEKIAEKMDRQWIKSSGGRPMLRDELVSNLEDLMATQQANVILVGEPGCGKSAILRGAVSKIIERSENLSTFWNTSAPRIIAGMQYLGEWEERVETLIAELNQHDGYLCVESLRDIVHLGGESPEQSIASFLLPYLKSRQTRVVVESTESELEACRQIAPRFIEPFQIIRIESLDRPSATTLLKHHLEGLVQQFKLDHENGVAEATLRLFKRFLPYQAIPGETLSFLRKVFETQSRKDTALVTRQLICEAFCDKTGLSELIAREDMPIDPADVVDLLENEVIGQTKACQITAKAIATFKAGLNDPGRPISVMLFCGPTGVGKTQLVKSLSKFLFDENQQINDHLIRLDMSEYAGPDASRRIVGTVAEPGTLIRAARKRPFCIVLLDEIEKAHPEVFDLFLNLFDEGYLKDRTGRITYFRSAIIVMTSNIGTSNMDAVGFDSTPKTDYMRDVMRYFRPEFFNRMDHVVSFASLDADLVRKIVEKELHEIREREGIRNRELQIEFTDEVIDHITETGFDARLGARPLQRAIENEIITPISQLLLADNSVNQGSIQVSLQDGVIQLHFQR